MPSRRQVLGTLGACAAAASSLPAAAQFRVEISGVGATQIPIVVGDFRNESAAGTAIGEIVRADLARSGLFRTGNAPEALDERASIVAADWRARGVDAVVGGSVARLADGRFDVRYKLWDAVRGEELLGRSQLVVAADLRLAAHRVADEIYQSLLGEPGVFSTRIAYVLRSGRRHTLYVTDADGERPQVALASAEPIISPAWSPDGRELAYVSFETQKAVVWVQNLGNGERRALANFRGSNSAPAWSPDGRELVVTLSTTGIAQLFVMPRGGGSPRRLTSSSAIDTEAAYSPDGRFVYFVSDRGGSPQIYRVATAGGGAERMTFAGSQNISPAISPDGRQMAYVTRQGGGAFKLALMDLAGGGSPRLLTETSDDESPSFAPNGRLIVYTTRERGRDALMTTTLDGKIKTRLVSTGADMLEPAWGPFNR
jgi:TolB protein